MMEGKRGNEKGISGPKIRERFVVFVKLEEKKWRGFCGWKVT